MKHSGGVVALALSLALSTAGISRADIIVETDTDIVNVAGIDMTRHTVRLVADGSGETVAGWEGDFSGDLYQDWDNGGATPTPTADVLGGVDPDEDSHFLIPGSAGAVIWMVFTPASEDMTTGPNVPDDGWGTKLEYAFALQPAAYASSLDLAQLIVPLGAEVTMSGLASNQASAEFDTNKTLPEPATLALLGGGMGIGCLARYVRRRKA